MNVYVHGQNGRFYDVKISPFLDFEQEKHFKKIIQLASKGNSC